MRDCKTEEVMQPAWPGYWQTGNHYLRQVWIAALIAHLVNLGASAWRPWMVRQALRQIVLTLRVAFRLAAASDGIRGAEAHGKQKETQFFKHWYSCVEMSDDEQHPWRAVSYASSISASARQLRGGRRHSFWQA
jgi:hypothetical protein